MAVIQTRMFKQMCLSNDSAVDAAMTTVVTDVNQFLAALPSLGDALDVRYDVYPLNPERAVVVGTVIYVGAV